MQDLLSVQSVTWNTTWNTALNNYSESSVGFHGKKNAPAATTHEIQQLSYSSKQEINMLLVYTKW